MVSIGLVHWWVLGHWSWQPHLGIEYACSQWVDKTYTQEGSTFFSFRGKRGWQCEDGIIYCFVPIMFSTYYNMLPMMFVSFPMGFRWCSPRVFPITPHFTSYPLLKKISFHLYTWAKGEALQLHIEIVLLGNLPNFSCYFGGGWIKLAHYEKPKKNLGSSLFNE